MGFSWRSPGDRFVERPVQEKENRDARERIRGVSANRRSGGAESRVEKVTWKPKIKVSSHLFSALRDARRTVSNCDANTLLSARRSSLDSLHPLFLRGELVATR